MVTDITPLRNFLADQIREEGARHHLDIVLTSKRYGSLDGLAEVNSPSKVKLALIPGGVTAGEYPTVRMVTALTNEPLHVLVRPELAAKGLAGLRGKRVCLGPATTSSHHLAREVLNFVGLVPQDNPGPGGYILLTASPDDLFNELRHIEPLSGEKRSQALKGLPDAVLFLEPLPSPLARQFVTVAGYVLVPLPFAEAFCLDRLSPPNPEGARVNRSLLSPSVIPAFTYGATPAEPEKGCATISAPLLLVAQDDADPDAIARLLEIIHDSPLTGAIRPPPLREQVAAFPFHIGAERYKRRHEPWLTPELAAKLGTVAGGIGALISGLVAFYTFWRLRAVHRFESYYRELARIESIARGAAPPPAGMTAPGALRTHLEAQLSQLKSRALEDFAEGGLRGEGLMAGIIALINDTRNSLEHLDAGPPGPGPVDAS
jgi:TRAP-type uncharacterized transport system substrate-binding protein